MDMKRAKEILSSSEDINVNYQGNSVWIDRVNNDGRTATIHVRGASEQKTQVEISELKEIH